MRRIVSALAVATAGCSLLVDVSGLSSGDAAAPDASASVPVDATSPLPGDGAADASLPDDASVAVDAGGTLWSKSEGGNGHRYEVVYAKEVLWTDAVRFAEARGGYLATITSPEENAFVATLVAAAPRVSNGSFGPWLGGFQPPGAGPEPAGGWAWVTGEPWGYTSWAPEEPNNAAGPAVDGGPPQISEGVLAYYRSPAWGDYLATRAYGNGYVVEWN